MTDEENEYFEVFTNSEKCTRLHCFGFVLIKNAQ